MPIGDIGSRNVLGFDTGINYADPFNYLASSGSQGKKRSSRKAKRSPSKMRHNRRRHGKASKKSSRTGKIHYAKKTGQPYIILKSGKAKFIKGRRRK